MSYEDDNYDEEVDKLAKDVVAKIGLTDGIVKKLRAEVEGPNIINKIFAKGDFSKSDVSDMSADEKIVAFFLGMVRGDQTVIKALSEGVAADGGNLVPDEFRAELIKDLEAPTTMRSLVRVVPMHRDVMKIPKLGSKPQVRWTSENAAKSTTTADFSMKTLTAYKCAAILYASEELVEDSAIPVVKMIIGLFSEALRAEEDKVITQGTGVGQPTGLTVCTITNVACNGNLDFDDIINLIYELPAQYRRNAKFLVNVANLREMRKIKDDNGRYIWSDNVVPGQPATVYGYPIIENNWLPESEIYFGDFKLGYWLGDRRRVTVTVSNVAGDAWLHDQVGIRVVERIAGNCVLENAIRCLNSIP